MLRDSYCNAIVWVAGRIPPKLVADPERVALHLAFVILGAGGILFVQPGSLNTLLPVWAGYAWAAALLIGGLAAVIGYWTDRTAPTRLGHRLLLLGSMVIVVSLAAVIGTRALTTIVIFTLIGLAYMVRLTVSQAARIILRRGDGR